MNDFLWTEIYRPHKVQDCVLPVSIKNFFQGFVDQKDMPNLILAGISGVGKTSIALATLDEIGCDYIKINSALKRGIDTVRDEMMQFATTMSFNPGRKFIILDEADGILPDSQKALNAFLEEYASNCGFIFTCNNLNKIIPAIQSRCSLINFVIVKSDFPTLAKEFFINLKSILDSQNIKYDQPVLVEVIKKFYPDWRRILVEVQSYSVAHSKIDSGILAKNSTDLSNLITYIKQKKWTLIRSWVGENFPQIAEFTTFSRALMKDIEPDLDGKSVAFLVVLMNKYDFQNATVVDKEINMVAFLTEVMMEMIWK
jgi:DNA polymerase III delta prime subunit